ncbi:hypothetical protein D3C77_766220 [compost metagenome]
MGENMKVSKEAQLFIDRCYKDGKPAAVNPLFGVKYNFDGIEVKFTEELLQEIEISDLVKVSNKSDKMVSLNGVG